MSFTNWRWPRRTVQILALLLFIYLLLGIRKNSSTLLPYDSFFIIDPLAGFSTIIASRSFIPSLFIGGTLLLILTFVFGRFWCGWICPMGTIFDWARLPKLIKNKVNSPSKWQQTKYYVLLIVLLSAVLGSLTLMVIDPITLLYRTFTSAFLPIADSVITSTETYLYRYEFLQGNLDNFDIWIRTHIFPLDQSFIWTSALILSLFILIIIINTIRHRFWCQYLCPLGALLGIASKVSLFRRVVNSQSCISCERCIKVCSTVAINSQSNFSSDPSECSVCFRCVDTCPTKAISFSRQLKVSETYPQDLSRRRVLGLFSGVIAGAIVLRLLPVIAVNKLFSKRPIRPPGASEASLLKGCIRCGQCINVCPTGGLQPSSYQNSPEDLWNPVLVPRQGECDYSCTRCGEVCPTGAIKHLTLESKHQTKIGTAHINRERCIPWTDGRNCLICEEMCPLPEKAIVLDSNSLLNQDNSITTVLQPRVIEDNCIGCGVCENRCPLNGSAAIRVDAV